MEAQTATHAKPAGSLPIAICVFRPTVGGLTVNHACGLLPHPWDGADQCTHRNAQQVNAVRNAAHGWRHQYRCLCAVGAKHLATQSRPSALRCTSPLSTTAFLATMPGCNDRCQSAGTSNTTHTRAAQDNSRAPRGNIKVAAREPGEAQKPLQLCQANAAPPRLDP